MRMLLDAVWVVLILVWIFGILIPMVKTQMWSKKRKVTLHLVHEASTDDIDNRRWDWTWRYDYLREHGSIWKYTSIPWLKYDDLYPDKFFITKGVDRFGRERLPLVR